MKYDPSLLTVERLLVGTSVTYTDIRDRLASFSFNYEYNPDDNKTLILGPITGSLNLSWYGENDYPMRVGEHLRVIYAGGTPWQMICDTITVEVVPVSVEIHPSARQINYSCTLVDTWWSWYTLHTVIVPAKLPRETWAFRLARYGIFVTTTVTTYAPPTVESSGVTKAELIQQFSAAIKKPVRINSSGAVVIVDYAHESIPDSVSELGTALYSAVSMDLTAGTISAEDDFKVSAKVVADEDAILRTGPADWRIPGLLNSPYPDLVGDTPVSKYSGSFTPQHCSAAVEFYYNSPDDEVPEEFRYRGGTETIPLEFLDKNTKLVAEYWPNWDTDNAAEHTIPIALEDIPTTVNLVFLFVARIGSTPNTLEFDTSVWGEDEIRRGVKLLRRRGTKVVLSVGGSTGYFILSDNAAADTFVASFQDIADSLGGLDGIDWNIETTSTGNPVNPDTMVYASQQLRSIYGPDFMVTIPMAGWTTAPYVSHDIDIVQALYNATDDWGGRILSIAWPQGYELWYDTAGRAYTDDQRIGSVLSTVQFWANVLYNDWSVIGVGVSTVSWRSTDPLGDPTSFSVDAAVTVFKLLTMQHADFRGMFHWTAASDAWQNWAWANAISAVADVKGGLPAATPIALNDTFNTLSTAKWVVTSAGVLGSQLRLPVTDWGEYHEVDSVASYNMAPSSGTLGYGKYVQIKIDDDRPTGTATEGLLDFGFRTSTGGWARMRIYQSATGADIICAYRVNTADSASGHSAGTFDYSADYAYFRIFSYFGYLLFLVAPDSGAGPGDFIVVGSVKLSTGINLTAVKPYMVTNGNADGVWKIANVNVNTGDESYDVPDTPILLVDTFTGTVGATPNTGRWEIVTAGAVLDGSGNLVLTRPTTSNPQQEIRTNRVFNMATPGSYVMMILNGMPTASPTSGTLHFGFRYDVDPLDNYLTFGIARGTITYSYSYTLAKNATGVNHFGPLNPYSASYKYYRIINDGIFLLIQAATQVSSAPGTWVNLFKIQLSDAPKITACSILLSVTGEATGSWLIGGINTNT